MRPKMCFYRRREVSCGPAKVGESWRACEPLGRAEPSAGCQRDCADFVAAPRAPSALTRSREIRSTDRAGAKTCLHIQIEQSA